jgi:hypothetical protein
MRQAGGFRPAPQPQERDAMTPETPVQTEALVAEWAKSQTASKQLAARLAAEMQAQPRGSRTESAPQIAARCNVRLSAAEAARRHLITASIIRKGPGRTYLIA